MFIKFVIFRCHGHSIYIFMNKVYIKYNNCTGMVYYIYVTRTKLYN